MLIKFGRHSISWLIFIAVTSVMGASLLTVFAYHVYASCTVYGNGASNNGQTACGLNWTITAKIDSLTYPDNEIALLLIRVQLLIIHHIL